jgi:hypothetical protein
MRVIALPDCSNHVCTAIRAKAKALVVSSTMPIRVAVMCDKCERIYLLAHPDTAKWIRFTPGSDPHPRYRLTCICNAERYFDSEQTNPYRVSEFTCIRGHADRNGYDAIPNHKSSLRKKNSQGS